MHVCWAGAAVALRRPAVSVSIVGALLRATEFAEFIFGALFGAVTVFGTVSSRASAV